MVGFVIENVPWRDIPISVQGRKAARKTNKGELEEHIFCHVTKPAVNNADGQCCELRWYQSHKWRGFMLAARRERERERDAASHTGRSSASSCNVGSPNGHVVTQQTCLLAYCPGLSLLSPPVFCFRVERSPVSRYTRNIRAEIYRRFANLEQRVKQLPSPRSKPSSNGIRWLTLANSPLLRCFYPACNWMRVGNKKRGRGEDGNGRKIQRWNLQSTIAWSRYLYCPAGVTYQAQPACRLWNG